MKTTGVKIVFETDNEAFSHYRHECATVIRKIADKFEAGAFGDSRGAVGTLTIRATNGNRIGCVDLTDGMEPEEK